MMFLRHFIYSSVIYNQPTIIYLLLINSGLRVSIIASSVLLTTGKALQVIPILDSTTKTILINIGQLTAMLSCPVVLGAPACVSATWFPPKERTTATAVSSLIPLLGLSVASIAGPYMVPVATLSHASNATSYDIEGMLDNITIYLEMQLALSAILLICVLVYFPDKPPSPPSPSNIWKGHDGSALKVLLKDSSYMFLSFVFSVNYGVYFSWYSVLALAVKPFGVGETKAGYLGCSAILAGCLSGIIVGR